MKTRIASLLAFLQALGLLAADYTAEEVAAIIDGLDEERLEYPPELSEFSRQMKGDVVECRKCGGKMRLKTTPMLMSKLADMLSARGNDKYELIDTSLCPHCGDGKFYIKATLESLKAVRAADGTIASVPQTRVVTYPVTEEDLLLLYDFLQARKGSTIDTSLFRYKNIYKQHGRDRFFVQTDEQYKRLLDSIKYPLNVDKPVLERRKRDLKAVESLSVNAKVFQWLTESATVLRKEDLDDFLKALSNLRAKEANFIMDGNRRLLTRMALGTHPTTMVPLTCPHCKGRFYVRNGAMYDIPLNDMLSLLGRLDIVPDYSSLCPYCRPDSETFKRRLDVRIRLGGKEYPQSLSPADLELLSFCLGNEIIVSHFGHMQKRLTPSKILRLRSILQGKVDDSALSAVPVEDDSK